VSTEGTCITICCCCSSSRDAAIKCPAPSCLVHELLEQRVHAVPPAAVVQLQQVARG
jgi:hypothetical protein